MKIYSEILPRLVHTGVTAAAVAKGVNRKWIFDRQDGIIVEK